MQTIKTVLTRSLVSGSLISAFLLFFNWKKLSTLGAVALCAIVILGSIALGFAAYNLGLPPYSDNDHDSDDNA